MRIPKLRRQSQQKRLLDKLTGTLNVPSAITSKLPSLGSENARKVGLITGTLTGLTAGSAGISSIRRRNKGARENS